MKGGLMSYTLGINSFPSFKYSADNKYAREYYNACKELENAQYKVNNCDDSKKMEALLDKKEYWEKKIPDITAKVKKEEAKLESNNNNGQHQINYLA